MEKYKNVFGTIVNVQTKYFVKTTFENEVYKGLFINDVITGGGGGG